MITQDLVLTTTAALILLYIAVRPLFHLFRDRKAQKALLIDYHATGDLRIQLKTYTSVIYNFGHNYDYLKFYFTSNEVFVFMRKSASGTYYGPFLIKEKRPKNYSYLAKLQCTGITISGNSVKVKFGHTGLVGMKYTFQLADVSERDITLLKSIPI